MITAFAVPSPNSTRFVPLVFSGSGVRRVTSVGESPSLLRIDSLFGSQSFRPPATMTIVLRQTRVNFTSGKTRLLFELWFPDLVRHGKRSARSLLHISSSRLKSHAPCRFRILGFIDSR